MHFDLMLAILLGFLVLVVLLLLHASRASKRKDRDKAAGSQPFQANSCGGMAAAPPESVSVDEKEAFTAAGEEGKQQSSPPGTEGEGWTVAGGGKFSHPVYKKLSSLSGELNGLPLSKVKEKLSTLHLSSMYVHRHLYSICDIYHRV